MSEKKTVNMGDSLAFPSSLRTVTPSYPVGWKSISRLSPTTPILSQACSLPMTQPPSMYTSPMSSSPLPVQSMSQSTSQQGSQPCQPVSQSVNQQVDQSVVNQSVSQPMSQPMSQPLGQPAVAGGIEIALYPIDKLALCDSKKNLRFVPILSSAEATKQGELNLILDVKTLPTPSYILDAAKVGYLFVCSKSGKCVTVKTHLNLLICTDPCSENGVCKYVSFSQICQN